jgi:hypothetical protein
LTIRIQNKLGKLVMHISISANTIKQKVV